MTRPHAAVSDAAPGGTASWLNRHWVAIALGTGCVLLSIAPVLARSWPPALLWVFLQTPVYMLHQVEEHADDRFRTFVNRRVFGGVEALTPSAVLWINLPGVWGVTLASLYAGAFAGPGWGLAAIYLTLVNAVVHVAGAAAVRGYNPGLWTALALFIPVSGHALHIVAAQPGVGAAQHLVGFAVAAGIHVAIVIVTRRRAARLRRVG